MLVINFVILIIIIQLSLGQMPRIVTVNSYLCHTND